MTNDVAKIAAGLTKAQRGALLAMPNKAGIWVTCAEMRPNTNGAALDSLFMKHGDWKSNRPYALCQRQWVKWGSEPGQKRGEGYEYAISDLGLAVRAHLKEQANEPTEIVEAMAKAMQADCSYYSDLTWEETPARRKAVFIRRAQATYDDLAAQGLCVVPKVPTDAMLEAALFANENALLSAASCTDIRNAYAAMLAAAPGGV